MIGARSPNDHHSTGVIPQQTEIARPVLWGLTGGAAMGYSRAGFHVTGVDILHQPRYVGDAFVQGDALKYVAAYGHEFDVIHASPPCQGYSRMRHLPWLKHKMYPLMIDAVRSACRGLGVPFVIENVENAPLDPSIVLCGQMFDLPLYRHRRFELSHWMLMPPHPAHTQNILGGRHLNKRYARVDECTGIIPIVSVVGHTSGMMRYAPQAMGIDWMRRDELTQAIPPAYTYFIGQQLLKTIT